MFTSGIVKQYLDKMTVDIEDTSESSKYFEVFNLVELNSVGRHYFGLRGSVYLKPGSEISGELIDQWDRIVPLFLINQEYSNLKGVATVGYEIYTVSVNGELYLTLVGTTIDNKIVRWKKILRASNEIMKETGREDPGGYMEMPLPVEVPSLTASVRSYPGYYAVHLTWPNVRTYIYSSSLYSSSLIYIGTQSQGSASAGIWDWQTSPPTTSELTDYQIRNMDYYHVFVYAATWRAQDQPANWSLPDGYPDFYYPKSIPESDGNGKWYWATSIPVQNPAIVVYDYGSRPPRDEIPSMVVSTTVNCTLAPLPAVVGKPYYFYVGVTTPYCINIWEQNLWSSLTRGLPTEAV